MKRSLFNSVTSSAPRFVKPAIVFVLALFLSSSLFATTYYWKGGANAYNTAASWNVARDGSAVTGGASGGGPSNFTTSGDIFIVQGTGATTNGTNTGGISLAASNQTITSTSGTWTLGAGVTLEIEGGATATTSVSSGFTIANIIIDGNSTTYGTLSTTGSGTISNSGTTTCNGFLSLGNTSNTCSIGTLNITNPASLSASVSASRSFNVTGNLSIASGSTVTLTGACGITVTGSTSLIGTFNGNGTGAVSFSTVSGTGTLNATKTFTVTTIASSPFFAASGGTVKYTGLTSNLSLLSSYNNLTVDDNGQNRTYTPSTTIVYGDMVLSNNLSANIFKLGGIGLTVNGNLTIGTLATLNTQTFAISVKGNVTNNGTISGTGNLTLSGTSTQTLSGAGAYINTLLSNTTSGNISLGSNITSNGILYLNSQILNLSSYTLTLGTTSSLYSDNATGTAFSSSIMLKSDGVSGCVLKNASAALSAFVFPLGIGSNYLPATITTAATSNVTVLPKSGAHSPATNGTQINEYWRITSSAATNVTTTLGFPETITVGSYVGSYYSASWTKTAVNPTGSGPYSMAFAAVAFTAAQVFDYTVETSAGCTPPSQTITASTVCSGSTGNTASVPTSASGTYLWSISGSGSSITSGGSTATVTYTAGTSASLSCVVTNSSGCASAGGQATAVTINTPPAIGTNPSPVSATTGGAAVTMTVGSVTGTTPTYQWQRANSAAGSYSSLTDGTVNNITYSGTSTATLSITAGSGATLGTNDYYQCVVNGASPCSSVTSSNAALTISSSCTTPTLTYNVTSNSNSYCGSGSVTLGLDNSQTGVTYQLYDGGSALSGVTQTGTGSAITFTAQTPSVGSHTYTVYSTSAGIYCAVQINGGTTTSKTVTSYTAFTTGAIATTGQTICTGGTPTVIGSTTSASGGDGNITYSWRSSADAYTGAIGGATASTYTPPSGLSSTTSYRRYANDGTCNSTPTVSTGTWAVTVNASLTTVSVTPSTTQTFYTTMSGATLTAAENGGGTITRQWGYRTTSGGSITNISGATSATYTPTGAALGGGLPNTYYLVCTSTPATCGTATISNEVIVVTQTYTPVTYYLKPLATDPTLLASWNTARDGNASSGAGNGSGGPINFSMTGDIFIIQGTGATTNGTNTTGTSLFSGPSQSIAAGAAWTVTGSVEIEGGATLSTAASTLTISNVIIDGDASTFGTLSATATGQITCSGTVTCKGIINLNQTGANLIWGTLSVTNPSSQVTSVSITAKGLTCSGTLSISNGSVVSLSGGSNLTVTGSTTLNGTLNSNNTSNNAGFSTLLGTGTLNASRAFTVTTVGSSTFLAASGGTVKYTGLGSNLTLFTSYNHLIVDDNGSGRTYTPAPTTVYGNLTLPTNTANIFKQGTGSLTVNGDLTINSGATFTNQGNVTTVLGNVIQNGTQTFSAGGSITMGGTTQSVSGTGSFLSLIVANGSTTSLSSNIGVATGGTLSVVNGGNLNLGTYVVSGAGTFSAANGSIIQTSTSLATNITTTTKTLTSGAGYVFNSATLAPFGALTINSPGNLTINAAVSLDKSVSITGTLTLAGVLTTTGLNLLTLGTASTISNASPSSYYVSGPLAWSLPAGASGATYSFPVGTATAYLPADVKVSTSATGSTVQVQANGATTGTVTSGSLSSISNAEYWTLTSTGTVLTALQVSLGKTALGSNIVLGEATTAATGAYASIGGSTGVTVGGINGIGLGTVTSTPATAGTFYLQLAVPPPPTLTAAVSATVDRAFTVTYPTNDTWKSRITSITVDGTTLSASAYSATTSGQIVFTPSASTLLQAVGSKSIAVVATGYSNATVTQTIGVGVATQLAVLTQPTNPSINGAALGTQPVVAIQDQYGNTTSSAASIIANEGAGAWTMGGTSTLSAVAGVATFTDLTASSVSAVTGATISFTSTGLTGATSSSFNIPAIAPAIGAGTIAGFGNITVYQSLQNTFTLSGSNLDGSAVTVTAPSGFTVSLTNGSGYASSVNITGYGTAFSRTIYVLFNPIAVQSYSANLSYAGGGVSSQNLALTGAGIAVTAPTSLSITNTSDNIQRLSWTAPSGSYDNVLVFASTTATAYSATGAGSAYIGANANYGSASSYGAGSAYRLVFAGTGTNVEVTGLSNTTTYYYQVIAYSGSGYSTAATVNGATAIAPVTAFTASAAVSSVLAWTNPSFNATQTNYWNEVLVIASTGSVTAPTGDGTNYTANSAYGGGTAIGSGYVVYKGTGTGVTVSGLTGLTPYNYGVFVRHGSNWSAVTSTSATPVPYGVNDLVSVANGNYAAAGTWNTWNGTSLTTGSVPTATTTVWIVGGNTVTVAAVGALSKDLHVINGTLKTGNTCTGTNTGNGIITVSGTTVEVATSGTVGNGLDGDAADAISLQLNNAGTTTITGNGGTLEVSKLILGTASSTTVIDHDIKIHYHGSTFTGNAFGLYANAAGQTLTINAGKTVTMAQWSSLGNTGSSHSTPSTSFTLNVNGILTFMPGRPAGNANTWAFSGSGTSGNGYLVCNAASGNTFTLAIGGTGTVNATEFYPNGTVSAGTAGTGAASVITVAAGGVFNIDTVADFRIATQAITGAGTVNIRSGAILKIGNTAGITSSGATGPIQTTTRNYSTGASYNYAGSAAQVTGNGLPSTIAGLTVNNSAGLSLTSSTNVSGVLTLTSGILTSNSSNLLTLGSGASVSGGTSTCYVAGPMQNTISGTASTPIVFPIGASSDYNPVTLTITQLAGTATTYKAQVFVGGTTPSYTIPGTLSTVSGNKYYTLSSSAANISTASIKLAYDVVDSINGGGAFSVTTAANLRIAGSSGWDDLGGTGTASVTGTITSTNSFNTLGDFVLANATTLVASPSLTAASGATVDGNINITFTDNPSWRGAIDSVKYGSTKLTVGTDYTVSSGVLSLIPSGSAGSGLRTPGTQIVTVYAGNYYDATVSQAIAVGAAAKLVIKTPPVPPTSTGGTFVTQPAVYIQDQYGNATTSTANVTVAVGAGSWTLGGTLTVAAVNGTATFSGLTASAAATVSSATLSFTSGSLTSTTSSPITVLGPITYYWVGGASATFGGIGTLATTLGGTGNATAYTGMNTAGNSDVFIFDSTNIGGGAKGPVTITWPSSSVTYYGQIKLQNGANVTASASGTRTITIVGASGVDFSIPSGCTLSTTGSTTTFSLLTGTTGSISGTFNMGPGTSTTTLTAADASAVTFNTGANCTVNGSSTSTPPFGTVTVGSVIFATGSTLTNTKGGDVFGGNKVVTFQSGSTYIYNNPSTSQLLLDGNTYGNLTVGSSATVTAGSIGVTINGNLSVNNSASLTVKETGTSNYISGNINVASLSSLVFNPASASTFVLNGSSTQTITNAGTLTIPALQTIQISNSNGVTLAAAVTSSGALTLSSGKITLGSNNLTVASVSGGSSSSYIDASGTGKFIITAVPVTATTFPIGTATSYAPITLTGGTAARNITTGVKGTFAHSPVGANNVVNLEWSILASGSTSPSVTFQYNTVDKAVGYTGTTPVLGTYTSSYAESTLGSVSGSNPFTVSTSAAIVLPTSSASLYSVGNQYAFVSTLPGAPTSIIATAGNQSASVAFTAPAISGSTSITSYTVTPYIGAVAQATTSGSSSPISVTGLTNGTAYTFKVTATNSVGTGAASSASNSVTPVTVPGSPTNLTTDDGNTTVTVSFNAPVSNGGAAITNYTVTSSPGNRTATGASSPLTVTGLTNGVAYTFTVTATNSVGTSAPSAPSSAVTPAATTIWNGTTWSAGAPDSSQSAVINGTYTSNIPLVCAQLTVNSGATFVNNSTLSVTSTPVTINGTVSGAGTIVLAGSSTQTISGTGTINNLTLNNSNGATVSGTLGVTGVLNLQTGTLTTGGNVILKSTSIDNSGILGPIGTAGNNGSISGNITVERFIPKGYRAYRDMSANGVYNPANTLFNTWQESGSYTNNGYGMFITGTLDTTVKHNLVDPTTGIDHSLTGYASAYYYKAGWDTVTNTKTTPLNPYQSFRVLIRGDRSFDLDTTPVIAIAGPTVLAMKNSTTLRASGIPITGTVTYSTSGITNAVTGATYNDPAYGLNSAANGYTYIANPYACPIVFDSVYNNATGISANYYYLDPTIGSTGAWVSYNSISNTSSNPKANVALYGKYIQAGQGFLIGNNNNTAPVVVLKESYKATTSNVRTSVFGAAITPNSTIRMSLLKLSGNSFIPMDATVAVFGSKYSNSFGKEDNAKFSNASDNISITEGGRSFSIDARLPANTGEVLPISLSQLSGTTYKFVVDASTYTGNGVAPYLVDAYTNKTTALAKGVDTIAFTADAKVSATYQNRFSIVFKPTTLAVNSIVATVSANGNVATIKWNTVCENGVAKFEVEKSTDGSSFTKIGEESAKNTTTASYTATDKDVVATTSYYRIKAVSTDGTIAYSNIAEVKYNLQLTTYNLFPNPLTGKTLNVQLGNVGAGKYVVSISNALGQKVAESTISHVGGNGTHAVRVSKAIAVGIYNVSIRSIESEQTVYQTSLSVQ